MSSRSRTRDDDDRKEKRRDDDRRKDDDDRRRRDDSRDRDSGRSRRDRDDDDRKYSSRDDEYRSSRDRERRRSRSPSRDRSSSRDRKSKRGRRSRTRSPSPVRSKSRSPASKALAIKKTTDIIDASIALKREPIPDEENKQRMQTLLSQLAQAQTQQANVQLRKLYVGNLQIGIGLKDVHIAEFFNTAMTAAGLANGLAPPVQSVWMSSEGKFAFVEFRTPQDATNAMMLDGAMFHGRPLRIGRPAEMPNKSKPNLPNMGMGMGMGMAGMAGLAGLQGFSGLSSIQAPLSSILGGGGFGMAPTPQKPSKVIVLQNMVTLEDLENDDSYTDIMEDVRDECRNYGDIEEVIIPRPSKDGSTVTGLLKIFIKYSSIEGAEKARVALQGRKFASRTVIAEFMDELSFEEMSSSS